MTKFGDDRPSDLRDSAAKTIYKVVLVVQWFGVGLVIERSLHSTPGRSAIKSTIGQLSVPSLRDR